MLSSHLLSNMRDQCVIYERVVLSFPVISFVILIFVFQRFEIKSGFPFFWTHTVYIHQISGVNFCTIFTFYNKSKLDHTVILV